MSDSQSLTVSSLFSVSESGNGLIYPLLRPPLGNIPFVQIVDANGCIDSFVPLFETEGLKFFPVEEEIKLSVGDSALVAFMLSGKIEILNVSAFRELVAQGKLTPFDEAIPPLTRLAMSRLLDSTITARAELLRSFLMTLSIPQSSIERSITAEGRALLNQKSWWASIEALSALPNEVPSEIKGRDIEETFMWLIDHPIDEKWKMVLSSILNKIAYDPRLNDLLIMFTSEFDNIFEYDRLSKQIVSRGIEIYTSLGYFDRNYLDNDLVQFFYEKILNGEIFVLAEVLDPNVFVEFLRRLPRALDVTSEDAIVESVIDYLEQCVAPLSLNKLLFEYIENDGHLDYSYSGESNYDGTRRDRLFSTYLENEVFRTRLPKGLKASFHRLEIEINAEADRIDDQSRWPI